MKTLKTLFRASLFLRHLNINDNEHELQYLEKAYVNFIANHIIPKTMSLHEIKKASTEDHTGIAIRTAL